MSTLGVPYAILTLIRYARAPALCGVHSNTFADRFNRSSTFKMANPFAGVLDEIKKRGALRENGNGENGDHDGDANGHHAMYEHERLITDVPGEEGVSEFFEPETSMPRRTSIPQDLPPAALLPRERRPVDMQLGRKNLPNAGI